MWKHINVCTSANRTKNTLDWKQMFIPENVAYLWQRVSNSSRVCPFCQMAVPWICFALCSKQSVGVPDHPRLSQINVRLYGHACQHFVVIFKVGQVAFCSNQVVPRDVYLQSACATSPLKSTTGSISQVSLFLSYGGRGSLPLLRHDLLRG